MSQYSKYLCDPLGYEPLLWRMIETSMLHVSELNETFNNSIPTHFHGSVIDRCVDMCVLQATHGYLSICPSYSDSMPYVTSWHKFNHKN